MKIKIFKAVLYSVINPILFLKYIERNILLVLMPRKLFHRRLQKNPYINFKNILYGLDQKSPVTQKGLIDSYSDYLITEKAIKSVLFSVNEVDVEKNIKKFLKKGDVFFDVGAHFGYFSALGAACVGEKGQVHMFEPAPLCFDYLKNLQTKNSNYRFVINKVGVGNEKKNIDLLLSPPPHLSSHTLVPNFLETKNLTVYQKIKVPIIRLDEYIEKIKIVPKLIKIDVEGYEYMVLKGLEKLFKNTTQRPVIICEISPSAHSLLGHSLEQLYKYMYSYDYKAFYSWNASIEIKNIKNPMGNNVIFRAPKQ